MRRPKRVIERSDLGEICRQWREEGRRIVFTNGCFDLLHPGHLRLLSRAAELGDVLLVAINDDASVRCLKGRHRPVFPAAERVEILLALRWVDSVTVFPEDTPFETIRLAKPDVLVKGSEYEEEDIVGAAFLRSYGGTVARVPMKRGYSTRAIVERISKTT